MYSSQNITSNIKVKRFHCALKRLAMIFVTIILGIAFTPATYSQVSIETMRKEVNRDIQRDLSQPSQPSPPRDEGVSKNLLQEAINESNRAAQLMKQGYNYQVNAQRSLYSARDKENQAQKNLEQSQEIARKKIDQAEEKAKLILKEARLQKSARDLDKKMDELKDKEKRLDKMINKADRLLNTLEKITRKATEIQTK